MENFRATEIGPDLQIYRLPRLSSSRLTFPEDPSSSSSTLESTETMSIEWTDEKHSLYLKSMEASFVNDLYDSMELLGRNPEKENLIHTKASKQTHTNKARSPPGQFKVLRNGNWQKINNERSESQEIKTNENHGGLLSNPWILHFRSLHKAQCGESCGVIHRVASVSQANDSDRKKAMSSWGASSSKQLRFSHSNFRHKGLLGNKTEVSDQNFIDEDIDGEKTKRAKTQELDAYTTNDQVVPLRNPCNTASNLS